MHFPLWNACRFEEIYQILDLMTNKKTKWKDGKRVDGEYEEGEIGPEINEVTIGEDGIGFAEFFINEAHDKGQVMLAGIAHILYLRFIYDGTIRRRRFLHFKRWPGRVVCYRRWGIVCVENYNRCQRNKQRCQKAVVYKIISEKTERRSRKTPSERRLRWGRGRRRVADDWQWGGEGQTGGR